MADIPLPGQDSIAAQQELFRRAEAEHGLSIAVLSKRTPISISTLKGWRAGAAMPAWALGALGEAGIPDDLLSLILAPYNRHVGTNGDNGEDLDALAADAGEFVHAHAHARNAHSPGGTTIVPQERAILVPLAARLKARARQVAA